MKDRKILESINEYRKSHGLSPLQWNEFCANCAEIHTTNMANGQVPFSHDGWNERYRQIAKFVPGIKSGTENVAMSSPNHFDPVISWIKSPKHNKNMLSDSNLCGTSHVASSENGVRNHYYTAIFMKRV